MLRYLVDEPEAAIDYSLEDFKMLLAEVKKSEIAVMSLVKVFEACGRAGSGHSNGCSLPTTVPAALAK